MPYHAIPYHTIPQDNKQELWWVLVHDAANLKLKPYKLLDLKDKKEVCDSSMLPSYYVIIPCFDDYSTLISLAILVVSFILAPSLIDGLLYRYRLPSPPCQRKEPTSGPSPPCVTHTSTLARQLPLW